MIDRDAGRGPDNAPLSPSDRPGTHWVQAGLRRARRRREGMTLVEIMIVVIIMAMLATAVGVAVLPQLEKGRVKQTQSDAQALRSAAVMFIAENPGGDCPTVEDLVDGSYVDRGKRTTDAWDREFMIECEGDDVFIMSSGPDGEMGTEDDIE
ncbi:MAG TPA: prepilin-type N-terminal cleavage/methylation domain-containing protein [Polyangiaceae bacterium LLY-WYZ-14_1]|nr:prepilin-type N-terminal cleavage/methylation domain-containing protein [Polyangiaceae bacterium LLY-WYZ-14_1]